LIGVSHGVTVLIVVILALMTFRGAEWLEARRAARA